MTEKTCESCEHACIVKPITAECTLTGLFCPEEMTCDSWIEASEETLRQNNYDWSNSKIIEVD